MTKRGSGKSARKARPKPSAKTATSRDGPHIVGIGASAGGLEAFTRLLGGLAPDIGLAYVLVQHLSREHESLLPELLGRATTIPVAQAEDGTQIQADHAYVIPPNVTMTVNDSRLHLVQRPHGRGVHLPVDAFLSSLAEVHGPSAIAVILSGAGSDGSHGVEAIKEAGGIVFAQDAASARHPNMPEAAVDTGAVDFVLPPETIATRLTQIGRYLATSSKPTPETEKAAGEDDLDSILKLVHRRTGVDFRQYRRGTVDRRILRRMLVNRTEKRRDYLRLVNKDPAELDRLYQDILIGVTSFFRDPEVFEELRATVFPELARSRRPDAPFRVWVPGCSGGEEAYSLAIAAIEFVEGSGLDVPIQVFGTDLSEPAIARARAGLYPESIAEQVSPERLRRFFVSERGGYRIAKFVRDVCIFSRQNIVRDPPFSHLDLISCRNVLIYFEPALQQRVFPIFHYALEPYGMLLLGTAESAGMASELFEPFDKRHKIYRRRERVAGRLPELDFAKHGTPWLEPHAPSAPLKPVAPPQSSHSGVDLGAEIDRLLLSHFGRHAVVVDDKFAVVEFRGDTTRFLVHGSGSASLDVLQLARPELAMPLRMALTRAMTENQLVREKHLTSHDGRSRQVTIEVLPLPATKGVKRMFLVLFDEESMAPALISEPTTAADSPRRARKQADELQALRQELQSMRAYLSEIIAQHETSIEELRAAGEEIQSSNEELQSTNEELETTKEEVQSTNEELTTLNDELRQRNHELGETASDLANILSSTTIPIAIVDRNLRLRRFTPATNRVMNVVPTDVGRPLTDIKMSFELPDLEEMISNATETLAVNRRLIRDNAGGWWALTVRPYQTVDRRVDGAVLVFADGAEASEERRLALEAAEKARAVALRSNEALEASVAARERAEDDRNVLLRAQEEERRRLSRELHDEVGQHLTALGLGLHALSNVTPPGSEVDRRAEELRALVGRLGQELHAIALRLRPKVLDDFGLEPALASYAEEWSKQAEIAVDVHAPLEAHRLSALIEGAMYRIAQEALTNIAKHSGAKRASITIERRAGTLHVIIEDDGKGFDYDRVTKSPATGVGLGLLGIRERVALLGGTVDIETTPRKGTTLFIRVPITEASTGQRQGGSAEKGNE